MLSLNDIERAVDSLPAEQKRELHRYLEDSLQGHIGGQSAGRAHSVLDIAAIQLGQVLQPSGTDDDRLGEMLDGRS